MRQFMRAKLPVIVGLTLLIIGTGTGLKANNGNNNNQGGNNNNQGGNNNNLPVYGAPEVDPANSIAALALVSGVVLIIRGRRKPVAD